MSEWCVSVDYRVLSAVLMLLRRLTFVCLCSLSASPHHSPALSVGHRGKFGHEFLEFEVRPDGLLRYANNSNYKHDSMIRKEVHLTAATVEEMRRIVRESDVLREDDARWPAPNADGRQELEVVCGSEHISFVTSKIGSQAELEAATEDVEGLKNFYFLIQDIRCMIFSIIGLHFKIKPI